MLFKIAMEKRYFNRDNPEDTRTLYGEMPMEADSLKDAIVKIEDLMAWDAPGGTLQTVDPRIEWEEDPEEWGGGDWVYEDWTFGVSQDF